MARLMPVLMWGSFAVLATLTLLRLILISRMPGIYALNPKRWHTLHTLVVQATFAVWGVVPSLAIRAFGYHNEETLTLLFYHAALSFAMVNLLIHDLRLMKTAAGILFVPVLISQLLFGGPARWAPFFAFIFYVSFLLGQGKRLHLAYRQQISDNDNLAVLAHNDYLTGLPNRLSMNEALERSLREATERGTQVAVLYMDLDGFKLINDSQSHRVGDLFLTEVAGRLAGLMRDDGFVARLGGDEFAALITDTSAVAAAGIAADILGMARQPIVIEGHRLEYSMSIGVSLFPGDADSADHLMRTADHAMYEAKTTGKDRICFFKAPDNAPIRPPAIGYTVARDFNSLSGVTADSAR
jgi:diguanylate cyclase (GGDEF)-like protein